MKDIYIIFSNYFQLFLNLCILAIPIGIILIFVRIINVQMYEGKNSISFKNNILLMSFIFIFFMLGYKMLDIFCISISSFQIANGILLFLSALALLSCNFFDSSQHNSFFLKNLNIFFGTDIIFIPLSAPVFLGPKSISAIILWCIKNSCWYQILGNLITFAIFCIFCWFLFRWFFHFIANLSQINKVIMSRLIGIFLLSLSIELFINGIKDSFYY
ncbi:MarC family protein [Buchnera aphidicola]|uniref:UPF0056 membrane protein n=1 Tax=Buchnera aphidicola subsp. Tuberolachnus salignus TaxID=98804 RepID=A0A160SXF1_BUCTT|nr:MarC family protein [Buchnera aphidicola]CUR53155.1 UPF0056 membrane protein YhcE; MarC integral membrane family protein [Buchnera aphidicola (Tuberolachnus salignus)]